MSSASMQHGGDGLSGLAYLLYAVFACAAIVPPLAGGAIGYFVARRRSPWLGAVAGALLALGASVAVIVGIFFEELWDPPSRLSLEVPRNFAHDSIVLIHDPSSSAEIDWSGIDAPFLASEGHLSVPASGIVRVRELELDGTVEPMRLANGARLGGYMSRSVAGLGSGRIHAYFVDTGDRDEWDRLDQDDERAIAAYILAREAER